MSPHACGMRSLHCLKRALTSELQAQHLVISHDGDAVKAVGLGGRQTGSGGVLGALGDSRCLVLQNTQIPVTLLLHALLKAGCTQQVMTAAAASLGGPTIRLPATWTEDVTRFLCERSVLDTADRWACCVVCCCSFLSSAPGSLTKQCYLQALGPVCIKADLEWPG